MSNSSDLRRAGIRGYCDRISVAPGEQVTFFAASDRKGQMRADLVRLLHGDTNPAGPGFLEEEISSHINGEYDIGPQRTQFGSYISIPDTAGSCVGRNLTAHLFVMPTLDLARRQGLFSHWSDADASGWSLYIEDGFVCAAIGDGVGEPIVARSDRRVFTHVWYSIAMSVNGDDGTLTLTQKSVRNRTNSRLGLVVPLDSDCVTTVDCPISPAPSGRKVVIGGIPDAQPVQDRLWVSDCFNGKIDSPSVFRRSADDEMVAQLQTGAAKSLSDAAGVWDFSLDIASDKVSDVSGNDLHGHCVNQPERACTGWNWTGVEDNARHAPQEYGAIAFHDDCLDDCRWEPFATLSVPEDLKSDCYAVRIVQDGHVDHIPFFVLPKRQTASARTLLLIPTCSYLAYANWQIVPGFGTRSGASGRLTVLHDFDVEMSMNVEHYGLSAYETHTDGRSVKYSSWRRPISNMRPTSRHREFGGPWGFSADLYLVHWLNARGFDYDVATDHDLHEQGVDLLNRYQVVLTGTHPEYYDQGMIDAWEDYLAGGGRGMYLGANGMYWVVSIHPEKPWVMEIRKGESGTSRVQTTPGEAYHSTSGERGGLWRNRARPPQKVWGTGFSAFGFDCSTFYVQMPDARDPAAAWIMKGIAPDEKIGGFGLLGGGAAGLEVDYYDRSQGTPPNALLVASSEDHSRNYQLATEVAMATRPGMNGQEHPDVRGDITFFKTPNNGGMFASSSISWCASLSQNDFDNNVSRMTENVLSAFLEMETLP